MSVIDNGDMPINPLRGATNVPFSNHDYGAVKNSMVGLTKREAFAMAAMQGIMANSDDNWIFCPIESIAMQSVQMADELLKELSK